MNVNWLGEINKTNNNNRVGSASSIEFKEGISEDVIEE